MAARGPTHGSAPTRAQRSPAWPRLSGMSRLLLDVKVAARTAVRSRFVSVLAIVAFALGIGVTTSVFSIFNGVLLAPLPYPQPDQLVAVYDTQPACPTCPASFPKYMDWKNRNQVFAAIGGAAGGSLALTGMGDATRVPSAFVTASLGNVFGVAPMIGRWFKEEDDQPAGPKLAVLTYPFWTERFARDPSVLGRKITFNDEPYEVIGVMPEGFALRRAEVFVALQ